MRFKLQKSCCLESIKDRHSIGAIQHAASIRPPLHYKIKADGEGGIPPHVPVG
jgi:hypothetical protein